MARQAFADDLPGFDVERGEQRGRAIAFAIVCHRGGVTILEWQPRLTPIKRLDLRLFVDL